MSPSSFDTLDWVAFAVLAFAVLCLAGYTIAAVVTELREGSHAPMRAGSPPRGGAHSPSRAPSREPVDISLYRLPDIADVRPDRPYPYKVGDVRSIAPPTKNAASSLPDDAA